MYLSYFVFVSVCFYAVATPGQENLEPTKANAYLRYKWGLWCKINDINHNKWLSLEDDKLMRQYYTDRHMSDVGSKLEKLSIDIFLGGYSNLSCDDFVEMWETNYETNQTSFVQTMEEFIFEYFETLDFNGDKFLSKEEYLIDWHAFRHNDNLQDETFFRNHRLVKGLVPLDEAVEVWLRFGTEKDKSKTDIVVVALESGI